MILYGPVTLDWIDITYKKRMNIRQCSFYVLFMPVYPLNAFVLGDILYDTLDRIDITYRKRMLFVDVRFMFFPVLFIRQNAFVKGDVGCKYSPVRRKLTAGMVFRHRIQ